MPVQTITTPGGEELVVLSRDEYDDLIDVRDHAAALRDVAAGRMETLGDDDVGRYLTAPTPLAFWRAHRGVTRAALAQAIGLSEPDMADVESGLRQPGVTEYAALAQRLRVRIDDLIPVPDAGVTPAAGKSGRS